MIQLPSNQRSAFVLCDVAADIRYSRDRLLRAVDSRAEELREISRGVPSIFVIAHANSIEFFVDLFAVWKNAGCAACVNPGMVQSELQNVVNFLSPTAVLMGDRDVDILNTTPISSGHVRTSSSLDGPALILFTSGTTGEPKGVVLSHRAILARTSLNRAFIGDAVLAHALCVLPTHFGHGLIGNCLTPLAAGGCVFLNSGLQLADMAGVGEFIDRNDITFMSSVPSFWRIALGLSDPPRGKSLQRVHVGSAPLSAKLWQEIIDWSQARDVVNMYGITETANWAAGHSHRSAPPQDGLVGVMWGGEAAVRSSNGSISEHGEGELLLKTPSLFGGYINRSDLTAEVLTAGWYATGDIGRISEDGQIQLSGRARYVINRGGTKIYPEELDLIAEQHAMVEEACAFAIKDELSGELVGLAVKLSDNAQGDSTLVAEISAWFREQVRADAVPDRIFLLNEIPKSDRGKLKRDDTAETCLGVLSRQ